MGRGKNKWTPKKESLLRQTYSKTPMDVLVSILGMTESEIYDRAKRLKIRRFTRWEDHEIEFLKKHYQYKGVNYCAAELNKSYKTIAWKAYKLKLRTKKYLYKNPDTIQVVVEGKVIDSSHYLEGIYSTKLMHTKALAKTKYRKESVEIWLLRNLKIIKKITINEIQKTDSTSML